MMLQRVIFSVCSAFVKGTATGSHKTFNYGWLKMAKYQYNIGDVYDSKSYGKCEIVEVVSASDITIKFHHSGYVKRTTGSSVRLGSVKDPYYPSICSVGYIGEGEPSKRNGKDTREYSLWKCIIHRVYNEKELTRLPTYRGCNVCERWHNYQNFYHDIKSLEGYSDWLASDPASYHLDKDVKVLGNKIYSPDTCMFITASENSLDMVRRNYR